jgi:hypothetical protein
MRPVRLFSAGLSVAVLLAGCGGGSGSTGYVTAAQDLLERTGVQHYEQSGNPRVTSVSCAAAGGVRYSCQMYFAFTDPSGQRGYREALISVSCPHGRCQANWFAAATGVVGGPGPTATSSGSQAQQQSSGTTIGHDYVRIDEAFVRRPGTVPTIDGQVGNFNFWITGKAHGKDIAEDVRAAGFTSDPAPSEPLSPAARAAAAAVVIPYIDQTSSPKYGPLSEGYLVAFRHDKLEFRCKARGNPATEFCKGPGWAGWQAGYGMVP